MIQAPGLKQHDEETGRETWIWTALLASCAVLLSSAVLSMGLGLWPSGAAGIVLGSPVVSLGLSGLALATGLIGAVVLLPGPAGAPPSRPLRRRTVQHPVLLGANASSPALPTGSGSKLKPVRGSRCTWSILIGSDA
jgi:hypothetical protein